MMEQLNQQNNQSLGQFFDPLLNLDKSGSGGYKKAGKFMKKLLNVIEAYLHLIT
jgi:hypothetical protein